MDFELSADQVALQEGVRAFCAGRFPIATVRGLEEQGGVDRGLWQELAEMGVFSLRRPEADGGVGLGWADAVLVFEELGRALVPGPLVWTHLAHDLPGEHGVVGGIDERDPYRVVEHLGGLDELLVVGDDGVRSVDPEGLEATASGELLDPLTPISLLAAIPSGGDAVLDAAGGQKLVLGGAALTAALLLGISEAATELAVEYTKGRVQFDRPIGTFQALKHIMADMLVRTEVARGAVYAAGVTLDDESVGSVERAVAAAKITAADAAIANGAAGVQLHGGMGYTWEVDAHLHLKRAYVLEQSFGDRDAWCERMADLVGAAI